LEICLRCGENFQARLQVSALLVMVFAI
jgi:hypothetical protein